MSDRIDPALDREAKARTHLKNLIRMVARGIIEDLRIEQASEARQGVKGNAPAVLTRRRNSRSSTR